MIGNPELLERWLEESRVSLKAPRGRQLSTLETEYMLLFTGRATPAGSLQMSWGAWFGSIQNSSPADIVGQVKAEVFPVGIYHDVRLRPSSSRSRNTNV